MKINLATLYGMLVLPILLIGCVQTGPTTREPGQIATLAPTSEPPATQAPIQDPGVVDTPAVQVTNPTPNEPSRTRYTLLVDFDYAQKSLVIQQSALFFNYTQDSLPALVLLIEPNRLGAMQLDQVSLAGQPTQTFSLEGNRMDLPLTAPLAPGETLEIGLKYQITLPAIPPPSEDYKPVPYGFTERQANLVDWYFYLPPYQAGTGWMVHEPGYYGEFLVYPTADFDVIVRPVGAIQNLTLAGSSFFQPENGAYHAALENARTFAWSAGDQYETTSQVVGEVTVISLYFPSDRLAGQQALRDTAAALELYTRLFGPYPHAALTVIEADFLDGMEYDGVYFLSKGFYNLYDGTPKGYLTAIAVHETSHQWWFGLVGSDQAEEPWLDEALATYSERLYFETLGQDFVDWWWAYRVEYYQPQGWINQPIYAYQGFRPYRDSVYLNGAKFLEDLRQALGDEVFFAFIKAYAAEYRHQISTTEGFFTVLGQMSSQDVSGLKTKYFFPGP